MQFRGFSVNLLLFIGSQFAFFFSVGCFQKASFLFGSPKETYHGNIFPFSLAELENATENFSSSNLIGLGGSSYVYHGRLKDGSDVAVKRLKDQGGPEADSAFFKEVVPNDAISVFIGFPFEVIIMSHLKLSAQHLH